MVPNKCYYLHVGLAYTTLSTALKSQTYHNYTHLQSKNVKCTNHRNVAADRIQIKFYFLKCNFVIHIHYVKYRPSFKIIRLMERFKF